MHEYFRKLGYSSPSSKTDGVFQWHFNTKLEYFEKIHASDEYARDFDIYMANLRLLRQGHWSTWFPVRDELLSEPTLTDESVLIVDVGGGGGHDLANFVHNFPDSRGRLVLQDLPAVIKNNTDNYHPRIEAMAHDIFQKQPIRGARVYYTRVVLHDWSDDECRVILGHLRDAMKPGLSRLLLNELVIPDSGCSSSAAAADIHMMVGFGGKERTVGDWSQLAASMGLYVHKIWQTDNTKTPEFLIDIRLVGLTSKP